MVDRRLSERHLRTLVVVAAHDRLGKNGIGCWASHRRLATMVGCHIKRLSANLKELGEFGYIEQTPHPLNRRLRVYRVLYTPQDAETMRTVKQEIGNESATCPPPIGNQSVPDEGAIGNHSKPESHEYSESWESKYIPLKGGIDPVETEIDSPEGASPRRGDVPPLLDECTNLGKVLAQFERALKAGRHQEFDLDAWRHWLVEVSIQVASDDPVGAWANRLFEQIDLYLEEIEDD